MKRQLPLVVLFLLASSLLVTPQVFAQASFPVEIKSWWQMMMNWRRGRMSPPVIIPPNPIPSGTYGWQQRRLRGTPYPTGKFLPQLPPIKCPPPLLSAGGSSEELVASRRSFMECLLRVEEQKFGQLEEISEKLEARKSKMIAEGQMISGETETKLDEIYANIQSAKGQAATAKAKIRSLDLDKNAAEVKELVRPQMERLVNEARRVHQMQQGVVEELRMGTIEKIRGRTDGRWGGNPAQ